MDARKGWLLLAPQPQFLEALAEEEDATKIPRGVRRHQRHEAAGLGIDHGSPAVAVPLEEINQSKRRRVVFLAHLLAGLGAHLGDYLLTDRSPGHHSLDEGRRSRLAFLQHGLACFPMETVAMPHELID